jgi:hypothetical protein
LLETNLSSKYLVSSGCLSLGYCYHWISCCICPVGGSAAPIRRTWLCTASVLDQIPSLESPCACIGGSLSLLPGYYTFAKTRDKIRYNLLVGLNHFLQVFNCMDPHSPVFVASLRMVIALVPHDQHRTKPSRCICNLVTYLMHKCSILQPPRFSQRQQDLGAVPMHDVIPI